MLLTIALEYRPGADLGHLVHKHPDRPQSVALSYGTAHVFFPEVGEARAEVALLLDIDPLLLVKQLRREGGAPLLPYVNDRPYVASSFLSTAIAKTFGTAMSGRSRDRQALADQALPFTVGIGPLPGRGGGEGLLAELFEPLGYTVEASRVSLDPELPDFGESPYLEVRLHGVVRLRDLLKHLYVLIPVMDQDKHYWVGEDEIAKLLAKGEGWLEHHPHRETIVHRYLLRRRWLTRRALELLGDDQEGCGEGDVADRGRGRGRSRGSADEDALEKKISLDEQRRRDVLEVLRAEGVTAVADLGCGEGKLLRVLLAERRFGRILGMDVSPRVLEGAARRLKLDELPEHQRERIELIQGSLIYQDERLRGFHALCLVEVIEHLDRGRLQALERILFGTLAAPLIIVTTPNREYNVLWEALAGGRLRHHDHRFEWTRDEFRAWAAQRCTHAPYRFEWRGIGTEDATHGPPTQMAVFRRTVS